MSLRFLRVPEHGQGAEFGMLVQAEDSPVPIIDTTIAHAEAAADMALGVG